MLKSEMKSYMSVLKGLAKTNKMTAWKSVAIKDNTIEATDLTHIFTLKTEIKGSGLYEAKALDMYLLDNSADIAAFRSGELDDWVELPKIKWGAKLNLGTRHARRTLGEELIYGLGFVSNDFSRPALTGVWSQKGEIVATDGYRAYASSKFAELDGVEFNIDQTMLKAYKRLAKYGDWTLTIGEDDRHAPVIKLENENIVLISNQIEATMPDIRALANNNRKYHYKMIIPFEKVKALQDKDHDNLEVKFDGSLSLNQKPLPFKAEIIKTEYEYDDDRNRQLLMGLSHYQNDTLAIFSVRLAADFSTKDGNLTIRACMPDFPDKIRNLCYSVDEAL